MSFSEYELRQVRNVFLECLDSPCNTELNEARLQGQDEMLESVRGSLRMYPHGGGDREITQIVDQIVRDAVAEARTPETQVRVVPPGFDIVPEKELDELIRDRKRLDWLSECGYNDNIELSWPGYGTLRAEVDKEMHRKKVG